MYIIIYKMNEPFILCCLFSVRYPVIVPGYMAMGSSIFLLLVHQQVDPEAQICSRALMCSWFESKHRLLYIQTRMCRERILLIQPKCHLPLIPEVVGCPFRKIENT